MLGIAAPGRPVVHRHPIGQPIAPKGLGQARLHGRALLVGTGVKQDIKARMVIEHRQGMAAAFIQSKPSFEVHLPEPIGRFVLKAPEGRVLKRLRGLNEPVAVQDGGDGAGGRYLPMAEITQPPLELPPAPGRMPLPQRHHRRFQRRVGPMGRVLRTARAIHKPPKTFFLEAPKPLITGLAAHPKAPAQLRSIDFFL